VTASLQPADCAAPSVCSLAFSLQNTEDAPTVVLLESVGADSAVVGTVAAYALRARVLDASNNPVPGVSVALVAPSSGASVSPAVFSGLTNASGEVFATLDANTTSGSFVVEAVVSGANNPLAQRQVELTNLADAASSIVLDATPAQKVIGQGSYALTAFVSDQHGNPVQGAIVAFDGPTSGAGITPFDGFDTTDGDGIALLMPNDNGIAGSFQVVARIGAAVCSDFGVLCSAPVDLENLVDLNGLAVSISGDLVAAVVLPSDARLPVFTVSTTVSGATPAENVRGEFSIGRVGGAMVADLAIEARCGPGPADWCALPLSQNGDVLEGSFGGAAGFPMSTDSQQFRVAWNRGGAYSLAVEIVGAVSGQVYAGDMIEGDVAELALSSLPTGLSTLAGETVNSAVRLGNIGTAGLDNGLLTASPAPAPNDASVRVLVEISYDSLGGTDEITPADVLVEYFDEGSATYLPLTASQLDPSTLLLAFGPGSGFPTPAGYDATTLLRSAFLLEGEYQISMQAVGIDSLGDPSGEVFAETQQIVLVGSGQAATLQYVSGTGQSAIVDTAFGAELVVRVLTASGNPLRDEPVMFAAASSGASAVFEGSAGATITAITDNNGLARSGVLDANLVAGSHSVVATVAGVTTPVTFALSNQPGAAATMSIESGSGQIATVGAGFADLVVRVRDAFGNAAPGVEVRFAPPAAGASAALSGGAADDDDRLVATDAQGRAAVQAVANLVPGAYVVVASSSGLGSVGFQLENRAGTLLIDNIRWSANGLASVDFDGDPQTVIFDLAPDPGDAACTVRYNSSLTAPTNAGSYTVDVACSSAGSGGQGQASATLDIAPQLVSLAFTGLAQVFDGTPRLVATTPADVTAAITYDGSPVPPVNAGSYMVAASVVDPNYSAAPISDTLVVAPADVTVSLGNLSQTYDGAPKPVSVGTTPAGVAVAVSYDGSASAPSNAGSYPIAVSVTDSNYSLIGQTPDPATLVIDKATVVLSALRFADNASTSIVFNGAPRPATFNASVDLAGNGIVCTLTYNGQTAVPVDAGSVIVEVACDGPNHSGSADATLTIVPAAATVSLSTLSHVYDGTGKAATVTTLPAGLAVSVTYDGGAALPVDAGSYAVLATVTDPNYVGSANGTLVIAPAAATVTLSTLSHVYDGTGKSATVDTLPPGLAVSVTYDGGAALPVGAGSYAVLATVTDPNYVGSANGTLVIAPAAATVTLSTLSHVYDGTGKSATVDTLPAGLALSVTYDGGAALPVNAGSYAVLATVIDPNYVGSANGTLVIAQAAATVTLSTLSHVFDGTGKAATVATLPAGLAVSVTYDGGAALPVDAGSYAVLATVTDPNYVGSANGTLVIVPATAAVTLDDLVQVFDGNPREVAVQTDPAGLAVSVLYDGSPLAPSAVGSYAVSATVTDPDYTGSATAVLHIVAADVASLEVVGDASFSGIAGAALDGDLPSVRVIDINGDPVAGISVLFAGSGQGSLSGALATTDGDGLASLGGWTLSPNAGSNTLTARIPGRDDIASVSYQALGAEVADLAIQKTGTRDSATPGVVVDYLLTVTNAGPSNAAELTIFDALPIELDVAGASWICIGVGGAVCEDAFGTGDVDVDASLPVGGSITILVSASVRVETPNGPFTNVAEVALVSGEDPDELNNLDDFTVTVSGAIPPEDEIFSDGFEALPLAVLLDLKQGASAMLTPDWPRIDRAPKPSPTLILSDSRLQIQAVTVDGGRWLRMVETQDSGLQLAGQWISAPSRGLLLAREGDSVIRLDLGNASVTLDVPRLSRMRLQSGLRVQ